MLNQAVTHHRAGRMDTAEALYRQVLAADPDNADALHLLGLLAHQTGHDDDAAALIRRALTLKPDRAAYWNSLGSALAHKPPAHRALAAFEKALELDPGFATGAYNLANTLKDMGRPEDALAAYEHALAIRPDYAEACCNMGIVLRRLGRLDQAVAAHRRALGLAPRLAQAHNNLGLALHDQGRLDEARAAYQAALEVDPGYGDAWKNLGAAHRDRGHPDDAIAAYRRALEADPRDAQAYCNLGVALRQRDDPDGAIAAYRRALEIDPAMVEALNNLGVALRQQGKLDEAARIYRRVLGIDPRLIEARNNLGEIYEKTSRLDDAQALLDEADRRDRAHPAMKRMAATLLRRRGRIREALAELADLPDTVDDERTRLRVHYELGQLYDRDNRPDDAMRNFHAAKAIQMRSYQADRVDAGSALDVVRALRHAFAEPWSKALSPSAMPVGRTHALDESAPIFLVGFPRSGTTLLDQILDSHPDLCVLEERPCLSAAAGILTASSAGYPEALAHLTPDLAARARRAYHACVARHLDRPPGTRLVDKFPLNIVHGGLIHGLFPDAKIVLALRHPADVCLSSFMQYVELNDAMANFLTLEGTAEFYDEVMSLWRCYTEILPIRPHAVRYESLVADFRGEVGKLLAYLNLEWNDAVLDFAAHARTRRVATPSYHQVTEPIYGRASFRWRRYQAHLAPIMVRLARHVDFFGY